MKELKISEYSFHEFLSAFQRAVIDGFRLDLDSNERFPQKYGSHMEVTMVVPEAVLPQAPAFTESQVVTSEEVLTEEVPEAVANPEAEVPVVSSEEMAVQAVKARKGK